MVHGKGAASGPDLSGIAARSTRAEIEKWLDNPTAMMGVKSLAACPGCSAEKFSTGRTSMNWRRSFGRGVWPVSSTRQEKLADSLFNVNNLVR